MLPRRQGAGKVEDYEVEIFGRHLPVGTVRVEPPPLQVLCRRRRRVRKGVAAAVGKTVRAELDLPSGHVHDADGSR